MAGVGDAIAGALLGSIDAQAGSNFFAVHAQQQRERQQRETRVADQSTLIRLDLQRSPSAVQHVKDSFSGMDGAESVEDMADIVAGLGASEFKAFRSTMIDRVQRDAFKAETAQEKDDRGREALAMVLPQYEAAFGPDHKPAPGEGESIAEYAARLRGEVAAYDQSSGKKTAMFNELQSSAETLKKSMGLADPKQVMSGAWGQEIDNQIDQLIGNMEQQSGEDFAPAIGVTERDLIEAKNSVTRNARVAVLSDGMARGDFVQGDPKPVVLADGQKIAAPPPYTEDEYLAAGFESHRQAASQTYSLVRAMLNEGTSPQAPELRAFADLLREFGGEDSSLEYLPFEQQLALVEASKKVNPNMVAEARQSQTNKDTQSLWQGQAKRIVAGAGADFELEDRHFQVKDNNDVNSPLLVKEYTGLGNQFWQDIVDAAPPEATSSVQAANAWATRTATNAGLGDADRALLLARTKERAIQRYERAGVPISDYVQGTVMGEEERVRVLDESSDSITAKQVVGFGSIFEALSGPSGWEGPRPVTAEGRAEFVRHIEAKSASMIRAAEDAFQTAAEESFDMRSGGRGLAGPRARKAQLTSTLNALSGNKEALISRGRSGADARAIGRSLGDTVIGTYDRETRDKAKAALVSNIRALEGELGTSRGDLAQSGIDELTQQIQKLEELDALGSTVETRRMFVDKSLRAATSALDEDDLELWVRDIAAIGEFQLDESVSLAEQFKEDYKEAKNSFSRFRAVRTFVLAHPKLFGGRDRTAKETSMIGGMLVEDMDRMVDAVEDVREKWVDVYNLPRKQVESRLEVTLPDDFDEQDPDERAWLLTSALMKAAQ